jgi:hypothetical protein
MAFCTNCGTQTDANFCTKCGKPMGATASPGPPQPPAFTPEPSPAKRKTSPLLWILGAVVGLFVLGGILVVGAGFFIAHKAQNAGFDAALAEKNPALAAAKVMAALNPDIEIVNVDEELGVLTIKDKKTGKTITVNADDVKNGKMTIADESSGEKFSFGSDSAAKLPDWVPSYPGSKPEGTLSTSSNGSEGGMAHFKTSDTGTKVLSYYQNALKSGGFKITSTLSGDSGDSKGGMISAEDSGNRRSVTVTAGSSDGEGTAVTLMYGTKK